MAAYHRGVCERLLAIPLKALAPGSWCDDDRIRPMLRLRSSSLTALEARAEGARRAGDVWALVGWNELVVDGLRRCGRAADTLGKEDAAGAS